MKKLNLVILAILGLQACWSGEQYSLDKSIPRLQSSPDQIAYLRTKWRDGEHIETVFFDHQGRMIEKFSFGQASLKEIHFYEGNLQKKSIYYSHSDSSEPGYVSVDTVTRDYDSSGKLVQESHAPAYLPNTQNTPSSDPYVRHFSYTAKGDTIVRLETKSSVPNSTLADINRWERDDQNRLQRHYRLYVMASPDAAHPDTVYHFSQKFAYDSHGRLKIVWYDSMYLGQLYHASGPDTIWYRYDAQNRLSEEEHLYTTDMRNKREVDTTALSRTDRASVRSQREYFFTKSSAAGSARHFIKYRYEKFDAGRHGELEIP